MLTDKKAIKIISKADQKNVRDPKRARKPFNNIITDFFPNTQFKNTIVMDLGPGHYDLARLFKNKGAITHNIDRDPAVVKLGKYFNYEVYEMDLKKLKFSLFPIKYDGIFCKFSINAFWFKDISSLKDHITQICELVKDDAWGWIVPWNGIPKTITKKEEIKLILKTQKDTFAKYGFKCYELERKNCIKYGVTGVVSNTPLFIKNLNIPNNIKK